MEKEWNKPACGRDEKGQETDGIIEEVREDLKMKENKQYKIAVAGTGYVGLSIATLFVQHHEIIE